VAVGDLLLERYRTLELIAEGGQSLVYRVQDERLHRPACAKVFHVPGLEPDAASIVERSFVAEAELLSRLSDPGALQIFDFGFLPPRQEGGALVPFQICELVTDGPLSDLVKRRGALPPPDVVGVILPICRALAELHATGMVHLDIKPQNILLRLSCEGSAVHPWTKLADFGIAQTIGSTPAMHEGALLMYSVNWAAPEQLVGDTVTPASDVYSLALVTIYALTGRLVFHQTDAVEAYRLRRYADDIIRRTLTDCGFPAEVLSVLLDACSFEPERRLDDVLELGRRLEQALEPLQWPMSTQLVGDDGDTEEGPPPMMIADRMGSRPALPGADHRGGDWGPFEGPHDNDELPADGQAEAHRPRNPAVEPAAAGRVAAAHLWSLSPDRPSPVIAGRKLQFLALAPEADLAPKGGGARLRISLVPSAGDRPGLHIKGLSCFVAAAGGRPSPAVTLRESGSIELVSARGERLAQAEVSFAAPGPNKSVANLADQCLVIASPSPGERPIVVIDFGDDNLCFIAQGSVPEHVATHQRRRGGHG
jgi:serine/threonine protein kinase